MNNGKLKISEQIVSGVSIIVLDGELIRGQPVMLLADKVNFLLDQGRVRLVLDLERLRFIDDSGLTEIVRTYQRVRAVCQQLKLLRASKYLEQKLAVSQLNTILPCFSTEDEAVRSFDIPATV